MRDHRGAICEKPAEWMCVVFVKLLVHEDVSSFPLRPRPQPFMYSLV